MWTILLLFLLSYHNVQASNACMQRQIGTNPLAIVCVCTEQYCDDITPIPVLQRARGALYYSSASGNRLNMTNIRPITNKVGNVLIQVDSSTKYQTMNGFGGAFTDATGINMKTLSVKLQTQILEGYFGQSGMQYTIGRVPIASCDFSTHEYSYDDYNQDFSLTNFSLAMEDFQYKIPFIKQAQQLSNGALKLFASPWSAPGWMKTNGHMKGGGTLIPPAGGQYYTTWANYFVRFFQEYHKQGIDFWGLTSQNEPTTGVDPDFGWQTTYFTADTQRDFIKGQLGPALQGDPLTKNLKLMILDDQRPLLPNWANTVLNDKDAAQYVSGIAIHWYQDDMAPPSVLTTTHNDQPNYFMLATEACTGYLTGQQKPILGDWFRAEEYAHDIMADINNWVTGWTDWNLVLDGQGGPNWVRNFVDAPIIANGSANEYYKQPMWYALAHFSKFVPPGSQRINSINTMVPPTLYHSQFIRPDGYRVLVVLNRDLQNGINLNVEDLADRGVFYNIHLEKQSMITLVMN